MPDDALGSVVSAGDGTRDPFTARRGLMQTLMDGEHGFARDRFFLDCERPTMGIAFSGGGIRSATTSLGAIQALAGAGRLLDFDYMSTVSGGGYLGSFLGSLFIPRNWRDSRIDPANLQGDVDGLVARSRFAIAALTQEPDALSLQSPEVSEHWVRSPVRWLRENGRYLAPNGASDYLSAATYLSRNWLAMIYVFATLTTAVLMAITAIWAYLARLVMASHLPSDWAANLHYAVNPLISPALAPALVALLLAVAAGAAYWTTDVQRWFFNTDLGRGRFYQGFVGVMLILAAMVAGSYLPTVLAPAVPSRTPTATCATTATCANAGNRGAGAAPQVHGNQSGPPAAKQASAATVPAVPAHPVSSAQVIGVLAMFGVTIVLATGALAIRVAFLPRRKGLRFFQIDSRRWLTRLAARCNLVFLLLFGLALVDTLGMRLHDALLDDGWTTKVLGPVTAAVAPLGAWIINKIMTGSDGKGKLTGTLAPFRDAIALVIGVVLFGSVAVIADTLVQFIIWQGQSWPIDFAGKDAAVLNHGAIAFCAVVLAIMVAANMLSSGFINLSSLHNLYMTRLTRSYLGAANVERMHEVENDETKSVGSISDSQPNDDMTIVRYQSFVTPAPLHLINVTLNETEGRDNSSVVERDRKGVPLVFAPEGVWVNAASAGKDHRDNRRPALLTWAAVLDGAEMLTLGQLCAISGAAVSTGMGANTSLGLALTLTFANMRLGYWWRVRRLLAQSRLHRTLFGTYAYLWREMSAQFRTDTARIYLSDGGHFENSGTYELLRRGVRLAVVLDNGADPDYTFGDLENLVRKARLDMDLTITVATGADIKGSKMASVDDLLLNCDATGWRKAAADPANSRYVLLLKVTGGTDPAPRWIIWIKPRVRPDDPVDVQGYALSNPDFPNESTADQFFNEAQWESYRKIGERAITDLLGEGGQRKDLFRQMAA